MTAIASVADGAAPAPAPAPPWAADAAYAARTLEAEPGSARLAREFAAATLRDWGLRERSADVELVAHEFVVNAMAHGLDPVWSEPPPHPVIVSMFRDGDALLCAAFDPGVRRPRPAPHSAEPSTLADAGRGLQLVAAVSDIWGWTLPGPEGKAVWAAFCSAPSLPYSLADRLTTVAEVFTGSCDPCLVVAA
ncbi:hypothetical protein SRB5_40250 [Streptomyces sp. RB5]|uniref:Histidine kinase/HSP90-like ATPase domain-containing protein n=1 Tax=Streptomyces smaragdinus TaxID=2585196 RepID=A0A7K0CK42_9ACTN|nr:ATP-binding protein [Streptomyces smaragdinus]MQY13869.1 hypothetical protein [Streptomyces smaragdinus]